MADAKATIPFLPSPEYQAYKSFCIAVMKAIKQRPSMALVSLEYAGVLFAMETTTY